MKYIVIIAIIVLLVRVDYWLGLFDKAAEDRGQGSEEVSSSDANTKRELISFAQDATLKQNTKRTFLNLLEDFRGAPTKEGREKAMSVYRSDPIMFGTQLDKELESQIFRWRDLLINNDPEVVNFLIELMQVLQGENLLMLKKFFSLWMEIDMENFITAYSRSNDTICAIADVIGDNIIEEEKINEYYAREAALKAFLQKENIQPSLKSLAENCLLVLNTQIAKMPPAPIPEPEAEPTQQITADPEPTGVTP